MKIFLHAPDAKDGTSFYRGVGPYSRLGDGYEIVYPPKARLSWEHLIDIDVCVFQRPSSQLEVNLIETCQRFNKPVIVDWDDNGFDIADDNPAAEFYQRDAIHASLDTIARLADIITVSTEELKNVILSRTPDVDIRVVQNAIDDRMFHMERYDDHREKRILMRGAGSHDKDWLRFKDGILQIMQLYPDYKLSVMGFHPEWLRAVPAHQIEYYGFTDIPTYFETLMNLRPKLMIVPLQDTKFNACKSAIAMYEGVVAGAPCIAANLPEFRDHGACVVNGNAELILSAKDLLDDPEIWEHYYSMQLENTPKLSEVNELRRDIIEELTKNPRKKWKPQLPVTKTATDLEFHNYSLAHGNSQDYPEYQKAHAEAAEWLIKKCRPKTAVEYGSGTGATLVELLKRGVMATGLEINPHSVEYFKEHHPMYANQMHLIDFTKEPIEGDTICDLGMSIEVFEHISMQEVDWENFIANLAKQYKYFYFSSTPYKTTDTFDKFWGHVNLRRTTDWMRLFQFNGWDFVENPKILTSWDLFFKSTMV